MGRRRRRALSIAPRARRTTRQHVSSVVAKLVDHVAHGVGRPAHPVLEVVRAEAAGAADNHAQADVGGPTGRNLTPYTVARICHPTDLIRP
jgi:hypothetical protein